MSSWRHWAWLDMKGIKLPKTKKTCQAVADVHSQHCRGRPSNWLSYYNKCDVKGSLRRTSPMRLNSVLYKGQFRTEYTHTLAFVPLNMRHMHQQGGEETLWDVTGGLLVLWIGSPWCQPSDDSHVDEVNFLLAKWEQSLDALGCIYLFKQTFDFKPRVESIFILILWVQFCGSCIKYFDNWGNILILNA